MQLSKLKLKITFLKCYQIVKFCKNNAGCFSPAHGNGIVARVNSDL